MWLVWQKSPKGPVPTIWYELDLSYSEKVKMILCYFEVKESHRDLSLDSLAAIYTLPPHLEES